MSSKFKIKFLDDTPWDSDSLFDKLSVITKIAVRAIICSEDNAIITTNNDNLLANLSTPEATLKLLDLKLRIAEDQERNARRTVYIPRTPDYVVDLGKKNTLIQRVNNSNEGIIAQKFLFLSSATKPQAPRHNLKLTLATPQMADFVLLNGINIGYIEIPPEVIELEEYTHVDQCYKCYQLDHITLNCKAPKQICSFCAGKHYFKDCKSTYKKCCLCGKPHLAIANHCPKRKERAEAIRKEEQNSAEAEDLNNPTSQNTASQSILTKNPPPPPPQTANSRTNAWNTPLPSPSPITSHQPQKISHPSIPSTSSSTLSHSSSSLPSLSSIKPKNPINPTTNPPSLSSSSHPSNSPPTTNAAPNNTQQEQITTSGIDPYFKFKFEAFKEFASMAAKGDSRLYFDLFNEFFESNNAGIIHISENLIKLLDENDAKTQKENQKPKRATKIPTIHISSPNSTHDLDLSQVLPHLTPPSPLHTPPKQVPLHKTPSTSSPASQNLIHKKDAHRSTNSEQNPSKELDHAIAPSNCTAISLPDLNLQPIPENTQAEAVEELPYNTLLSKSAESLIASVHSTNSLNSFVENNTDNSSDDSNAEINIESSPVKSNLPHSEPLPDKSSQEFKLRLRSSSTESINKIHSVRPKKVIKKKCSKKKVQGKNLTR